jgi:hypothetical protein
MIMRRVTVAEDTTRRRLGLVTVVAAAGLLLASALLTWKSQGRAAQPTAADIETAADADTLARAAEVRVFFGHQSVGGNIIDGIPGVYESAGVEAPRVIEVQGTAALPPGPGGSFSHAYVGTNGDPIGKLDAFDSLMRSGLASQVDVAMVKFCYVDVVAGTDVDALFAKYQATLSALERDYPDVTFLHLTTPLTTEPGLKQKIKNALGRGTSDAQDDVAREQFNTLMRDAYDGPTLFDLAAMESTAPDGSRVQGTEDGQPYFALYDGYAADSGHLNVAGSQYAAAQLLSVIAPAAG